jgi:hypothetical protein
MAIQNLNAQELNVALNQGVQALDMKPQDPVEKKAEQRQTSRTVLEKLFSGERVDKKDTAVLVRETAAKMQGMGLTLPTRNILNKVNHEQEGLLGRGEENGDEVVLSRGVIRDAIRGIGKHKHKGGNQGRNPEQGIKTYSTDAEVRELVQEYSSLFLEGLLKSDSSIFDKLRTIRERLLEKGMTPEEIKSLELSIKKELRSRIVSELQDRQLALAFAEGKVGKYLAKGSLHQLVDQVYFNDKLGGWDFGGFHENLQKAADHAGAEAARKARDFLRQEVENELIKATIKDGKDMDQLVKVATLAEKFGFDAVAWANEIWTKRKDDLGMFKIITPDGPFGNKVDTNTRDSSGRKQRNPYEYTEKDEKEILLNRLRAVYMRRAVKGDLWTLITTEFKVRKLKNGLFRLGIFTEELDGKVRGEALVLAKMRSLEMLQEALLERATLYELAGPAHRMIQGKIKGLLKNLERLGMPISDAEFVSIRDQANNKVYQLAQKELTEVREKQNFSSNPYLQKKEGLLRRLLDRISSETNLC